MGEPKTGIKAADKRMRAMADPVGLFLTKSFHLLGLFAIGAATVWAAGAAFYAMVQRGSPSIQDLLLLFIYLEIGSMVGSISAPTTCRSASCSMSASRR